MTVDLERALQRPGKPLVGPQASQDYSDQLDLIARLVANLPEQTATETLKERLTIISGELARRAE